MLFAFGCKSIKKAKLTTSSSLMVSSAMAAMDTTAIQEVVEQEDIEETEIIQETKTTSVAIDSAGITVIKPETTTVTRTKTVKKVTSKSDTVQASGSSSDQSISESSDTDTKDLDKSSEGQEVVPEIASAIFPTWGKIIGSVLTVLVPMIWAIWKKRKEAE